MLKEKFPGIKYHGLDCYVWSCEHCGEPYFAVYGDGEFDSKKIDRYLKSKISRIDFDECLDYFFEEEQEAMDFLIENGLYKSVGKFIGMMLENEDFEEYVSSEKFDEAINTLSDKKKISQDLLEKLLDSDAISDSLRDTLEEYGENDTDDDDEEGYDDEDDYDDDDYDDEEYDDDDDE